LLDLIGVAGIVLAVSLIVPFPYRTLLFGRVD
jgi:hypothetical protein